MADSVFTITQFLGGEWSLEAQGRVDLPTYRTAMNVCLNGIPKETGAWTRRPGTMFAGLTRGGVTGRVVSFSFLESSPYTMEFTDGFLRFRSGAALAMTNDAQTIVSISTANPAKVKTGTHGWTTGNQAQFPTLGTPDPLLLNRTFAITVTSTTEFTIADAITGAAIDGSTLATFSTGSVTRILEVATPYAGPAWQSLVSVQAEEQAVLLTGTVAPQVLTVTTDPTALEFAIFSLATANFEDGPYLDPFTNGALVTPSAKTGIVQLTLSFSAYDSTIAYSVGDFVTSSSVNYKSLVDQNVGNTPASSPTKWAVVSAGQAVGPNGFVGTDVGRHVRLFSEPPLWAVGSTYSTGNVVKYNDAYWTALINTTASAANAPGVSITAWGVNAAGAAWTWGKITSLLNVIDRALSGSVNIGSMTLGGGLAAAFDGVINQTNGLCARSTLNGSGDVFGTLTSYIGKNYSGASAQAIGSGTIFPSTDFGFSSVNSVGGFINVVSTTINLRAKSTAPSSGSDGTLLGTSGELSGPLANPVTISSSDTSTAWNYVWFEVIIKYQAVGTDSYGVIAVVAEAQFFSPPGSGTGSGVNAEILGDALLYTTSITTWRIGLYGGTIGWPTCGTYHEGRLWLSGSVQNRIDGSVPGDIFNFAPTESDGTVTDASAIDYTFAAPDTNPIFWMEPDQQGIICGTKAGEWLVQASANNNILTPTSIQAHRVTRIGCANIQPRRTEHTLVIVQKFARKIVEYFADVFSGKFTAPNLSKDAKHLTLSGIQEIAYQQELVPTIWSRCGDGSLIGASYKRDTLMTSQGPTFCGWHRTTLGSGRIVESICVGPSSDGTLDALSMVTNDPATNVRHVEIMTNVPDESTTLANAWLLDDGIAPAMTQNVTLGGVSTFQMGGLWPLNGKTVSVWAGGLDVGDYTVANGVVNVPFGAANGLFTAAYVANYVGTMPVVVGFTYNSDGQLVRPATVGEIGARNPEALGTKGRIHSYAALLSNTQGIKFGTLFDKMNTANFTTEPDGGNRLPITTLKSGLHRQPLTDGPGFDGMICWRVSRPYPATIAALSGFTKED